MCKNLAVFDWVWVLALGMPLLAVLVLNIADGRICYDMTGLKKKFSKKYHFIDKNFIVTFVQ